MCGSLKKGSDHRYFVSGARIVKNGMLLIGQAVTQECCCWHHNRAFKEEILTLYL